MFSILPGLREISSGIVVIILTVVISLAAAILFPVCGDKKKRKRSAVKSNVYIYILIMAGVTYIIRLLPLLLVLKRNRECNRKIISVLCSLRYFIGNDFSRHTERDKQRCICGGRFYNGSIDCVQRRQSFKVALFLMWYSISYRTLYIIMKKAF